MDSQAGAIVGALLGCLVAIVLVFYLCKNLIIVNLVNMKEAKDAHKASTEEQV
jgi:uncharacterized protein YqgC (DUF456 family)